MNKEEYNKLVDKLIEYSDAYYKENKSLIPDKEFDLLMKQLEEVEEELERTNPDWIRTDSLTQKVGSDVITGKTLKHTRPMLSLENTYNKEEVKEWFDKVYKLGAKSFVIEPKYDGVSFAARYKKGKLIQGLTRGDGEVGEDITQNLRLIPDLQNISNEFSGEVRGELMITQETFNKLNEDGKYANPRNLASGTIKLLDPEEFKKRPMVAYVYWLEDDSFEKHSDCLEAIQQYGFKRATYFLCFQFEDILATIDKIWKMKQDREIDVDLDGAVLKVDKKSLWSEIGGTSKFPHWAKAYKYDPETAVTKVNNIEFWVGHSGKITPVAILEPIFLSGSTVQKATLNNKEYMESLDIQIGDYVNIKKAAEIIPFINYVLKEKREGETRTLPEFPTTCPSCGSELKKYNEEHADVYCMNENCKARVIESIVKYTSTMELDGFAQILVERLYDAGLLCSIKDLYSLKDKKEQMLELDRMGEKLVVRLLNNIENSKTQSLEKFLTAISIKNSGKGTVRRLLKHYSNIDEIMNASKEDLMKIDDIGEIVAESIVNYFIANRAFIEDMRTIGLNMKGEKKEVKIVEGIVGKSFCITGALSMVRSKYEMLIASAGGKNVSGVTAKTDYLVTNDQATMTSKLTSAKALGTKIISENELRVMLGL